MQYRQEKKLEKLIELALLYGKARRRLFNTATTPCGGFATVIAFDDVMPPQQIAVLFEVCTFGGFGEIVFTSRHKQARQFPTTSKYFV